MRIAERENMDPVTDEYAAFLASKRLAAPSVGIAVNPADLNPALFPFQGDIVRWALEKGRAAIFADCGLGKTICQLEWGHQIHLATSGDVLILAPLAVGPQTKREGERFGIPVTICRSQKDVRPGINITNYEMLEHFDPSHFIAVVADESGILKNYMGKIKQAVVAAFRETRFRLACTATPAPNDHLELGNHADFLGIMPSNEMIMRWFINDTMAAGNYRLKHHGAADFWRWVSSWAISMSKPSDLGYPDGDFTLPPLNLHNHVVEVDQSINANGGLFRNAVLNATTMHREMRLTADDRAAKVAEIVNSSDGAWLIWCNTNYEADAVRKLLPGIAEVRGSDSLAEKERKLNGFSNQEFPCLLSKSSICGFGMNWQHCHQVIFMGLSYSYEQFYQALRRCWRFGQKSPVEAHIVMAESEGDVLRVIERKQKEHEEMKRAMNEVMRETQLENIAAVDLTRDIQVDVATGKDWTLHLGDSCQLIKKMEGNSIGFSVYSPPFENLYVYSDSIADMGNCSSGEEFFEHFKYLISELYRVTIPGRLSAVHCKDLPLYKGRDGAAGLKDFPGAIIRAFEERGWTYHSRVTIWKDPVIEMQRTKNHGLLYKNLRSNSCGSRQGMADYVVVFRKWVEGIDEWPEPVQHTKEEFPLDQWQKWASPVWDDIRQTNVLNCQLARDASDERHICPLQLDVVERALTLWSNPGDTVFSPFAGIGSEGFMSVKMGRKFIGCELKPSYWNIAIKNLRDAEVQTGQFSLFAGEEFAPPKPSYLDEQLKSITAEKKELLTRLAELEELESEIGEPE